MNKHPEPHSDSIENRAFVFDLYRSAVFNISRFIAIGSFLLFLPLAFSQERCKPLLPISLPSDLPCAANIVGGNGLTQMNPPSAIEQAREVLWDHFRRRIPSFVNLEVASKEGAMTRVVYVLEQAPRQEHLVLRWSLQRQMIDGVEQRAKWCPVENFRATNVVRDATTGGLTFLDGETVISHL